MSDERGEMIINEWDREPDAVNEEGVKFWLDGTLTKYARGEDVHGTMLTVHVMIARRPDGVMSRLLMEGEKCLMDNGSLEAVAVRIDMMKAVKRMDRLGT